MRVVSRRQLTGPVPPESVARRSAASVRPGIAKGYGGGEAACVVEEHDVLVGGPSNPITLTLALSP